MRKIRFTERTDGFCGLLSQQEGKAVIILTEDEYPDMFLVKKGMKWINQMGCSALGIGPEKSMKGLHSWPLESVENAVRYLKGIGYEKIGICGMSSGSNMALSAAARIPDITLTIGMTPMDWVYWGTYKDGLDGAPERPADGESAYTWRGKPLPYMRAPYPDYWNQVKAEAKRRGDLIAALDFHNLAEEKQPLTEDIMIPIENIQGRLLLAGAEDDVLWDTCRGIRRMEKRLEEREHSCRCETLIYQHCSHFIFPESLIKLIIPAAAYDLLLPLIFKETKGYVQECRESRTDFDAHIHAAVREWMDE